MKICSVWRDRPGRWSTWRSWLLIACLVPCLMACAGAPKTLKMEISAAADINPDARQRPSPVTVRIYVLKSAAAFTGADFLSLFSKEQAVLGAELLQKEEIQINPGERKQLNLSAPREAKQLAVMSAFRDVGRAQWRDAKPLSTDFSWSVQLSGRKVQLIQSP